MQYVVAGLEDQVVAVVELVDVDRHARDRRHDRRADRAVGDHAVALPAALGRDRHDRGGQVAQQLIDLVGLQDWHGTIFTAASERRARQCPQPPRQSFILQYDGVYYSMTALLSHLRTHLARTRLLGEPGVALVAVSGGADSVALLDLLHTLTPELGLSLVVAHVDHGIRSDSGTVARAVGELAERYELPFEVGELTLGPDATETVARRARYAWLGEVQRRHGARYLVTAHHRDDQVETILLRLLKGSAPAGLAGIPARGRGGLVRPLLPFTKTRLVAHVTELGLPIHDDPANRDPRHLRSWVRTVLLPLVGERLGARVGHLGGAATASGRPAGSPGWHRAAAAAADVNGSASAPQRPARLPGGRTRRNHSVGARNLPEC